MCLITYVSGAELTRGTRDCSKAVLQEMLIQILLKGLWGYDTFSCSTQLSMNIIMLINVKMPTFVGILTYVSMMNTS